MILLIYTYYNYITYSLLIFALLLATYLIINYTYFKKAETQKLAMIYTDLQKEKELAVSYKGISNNIEKLNSNTQQKLQIIKVKVLNLDFTLHEILLP